MDVGKLQEKSTKKAQVKVCKAVFSKQDNPYERGRIKTVLSAYYINLDREF